MHCLDWYICTPLWITLQTKTIHFHNKYLSANFFLHSVKLQTGQVQVFCHLDRSQFLFLLGSPKISLRWFMFLQTKLKLRFRSNTNITRIAEVKNYQLLQRCKPRQIPINYIDVHMVWIIKRYLKTKEVKFKKKSDKIPKPYRNKHKNYVSSKCNPNKRYKF